MKQDPDLKSRLEYVSRKIEQTARTAGRDPREITTVVVTKFHPAELIRELNQLGVKNFGESRHQEASRKTAELADLQATWHFVGQLQSNKARAVAGYCQVIHSLDRLSLLKGIGSADRRVDCFIELNLTADPGRGGIQPTGLVEFAELAVQEPNIRLLGVMAVAPLGVEPRAAFSRVREASDLLRTISPESKWISAGMSQDFEEAILEGATHLRIGTAITGTRPQAG
ncbi:MAG: YggS family pyridoxal phosphate-dependent enzyme [Microbacteriaceae bacterium]|nr:YggS family pyridoxal phosphate-dependent enzyme [Microbacteriaceae bacterium]